MEKRHHKPTLHSDWIDPYAKDIVSKLKQAGFTSYLVGGCVRDLLAGIHPKDYDIATDAKPNDVRRIIRGAYVIGKRFRLVLVKRGDNQFEVATFRRTALAEDLEAEDAPTGDNFFGTPEEDAQRRDFTVNALFYDPTNNDLVDFIDGVSDVENGLIKMIGDPDERLKEDPIRILRAIRLSHKLRFSLEPNLRAAIQRNASELAKAVLPRKREEYLKILRLEDPFLALQELYDLKVLDYTLPFFNSIFADSEAADVLRICLGRSTEICRDSKNTIDLVLPLMLALSECFPKGSAAELFDSNIEKFLRDEMGLFKTEIFGLFNLFDLQRPLTQIDYYKRKGTRRQLAFLERDNLDLALSLAEKSFLLTSQELLFWKTQFSNQS